MGNLIGGREKIKLIGPRNRFLDGDNGYDVKKALQRFTNHSLDGDSGYDAMEKQKKLLLLGSSCAGKSTILKQMKILHSGGFTKAERLAYKPIIFNNLFRFMGSVIATARKHDIDLPCFGSDTTEADNSDERHKIRRSQAEVEELLNGARYEEATMELLEIVKTLWKHDSGVRETIKRFEGEMHLPLSPSLAAYYLDRGLSDEIVVDNADVDETRFLPTEDDILRSYSRTVGLSQLQFSFGRCEFGMVDVGGLRCERKSWIHSFEGVSVVIFCVDVSEYDTMLFEDDQTNRMHESLLLFDQVCKSKWFEKSKVILLLNKTDLLREKIAKTDLQVCFPDYQGGNDYKRALEYIREQFLSKNKTNRTVSTFLISALDTSQVRDFFLSVASLFSIFPVTLVELCCSAIGKNHSTAFLTKEVSRVVPEDLQSIILRYHQYYTNNSSRSLKK
eukprot:TRINITY_DN5673_c0_g1_i1.p1 TRINITY_DN5673_c0_g1~~TRINITY_DN5673_c0_g1_i1.p1  ORF type:complete len:447 (-),score=92.22 TRINITY_DN5673_c0_g1_i1:19-1359(-)